MRYNGTRQAVQHTIVEVPFVLIDVEPLSSGGGGGIEGDRLVLTGKQRQGCSTQNACLGKGRLARLVTRDEGRKIPGPRAVGGPYNGDASARIVEAGRGHTRRVRSGVGADQPVRVNAIAIINGHLVDRCRSIGTQVEHHPVQRNGFTSVRADGGCERFVVPIGTFAFASGIQQGCLAGRDVRLADQERILRCGVSAGHDRSSDQ